MKKPRQAISAVLAAMLVFPAASFSARTESGGEPAREKYIVETDGTALLMRSAAAELGAEEYLGSRSGRAAADALVSMQDEIVSEIKDSVDPSAEVGYTYTTVFSGFSIELAEGTEEELLALPGVKSIYPVNEYKYVTPHRASETDTGAAAPDSCCEMMGIDKLHELGYDGEGQAVAVIDSELDVDHEIFQTAPLSPKYDRDDIAAVIDNNRLSRGFTADEVYRSEKIPFAYNYGMRKPDVYSNDPNVIHGTPISGIAVGKNGKLPDGTLFSGAAPEAQLIFFGVTNSAGNMEDSDILAALNDAVYFGVSAVNLSLGSDYVFREEPYVKAVSAAEAAGITVTTSAGNAARGNVYSDDTRAFAEHPDNGAVGSPAGISSSLSVASADNTRAWTETSKAVLSDGSAIPFTDIRGFIDSFKDRSIEYAYCGTGTAAELSGIELDGKLALIDRGGISFEEKAAAAKAAGAAGVIFASYDDDISMNPGYETDIPSAVVSKTARDTLIAAAEKTLTVTSDTMSSEAAYPGAVSRFSSWGPNASLELKPDITAPGGMIYSPLPDDTYAVVDGTSAAAPHIAGAAALITQYMDENNIVKTGTDRPAFIKNLLASGADIITDEAAGLPYSPRAQGAGLADLYDAVNIPVILKGGDGMTKISLYDGLTDNFTVSFTAENLTDSPVTYDTTDMTVQTDGAAEDFDGAVIAYGEPEIPHTAELPESVTVPANGTAEISIDVSLDPAVTSELESVFTNGFYVEGFVTLSDSTGENEPVNIPYMGFYGDWTAAPIFDAPYFSENSLYKRTYLASGTECVNYLYTDYCAVLGKNPLETIKGAAPEGDAEAYEGELFAGVSPNGDGYYDYLCIPISPLRTVSEAEIGIYAADGSLKASKTDSDYIEKYCQEHFDFGPDELSALPEGNYTVKVSGALPYGDAPTEAIEMSFYIDKTAPALTSASLREESGRTYIDLTARDGRYIAGFMISADGTEQVKMTAPAAECSASFDVTDLDIEDMYITVFDYAANKIVTTYANATAESPSPDPNDCVRIEAQYDESGRLVSLNITEHAEYKEEAPGPGTKIFYWTGLDTMRPIR